MPSYYVDLNEPNIRGNNGGDFNLERSANDDGGHYISIYNPSEGGGYVYISSAKLVEIRNAISSYIREVEIDHNDLESDLEEEESSPIISEDGSVEIGGVRFEFG